MSTVFGCKFRLAAKFAEISRLLLRYFAIDKKLSSDTKARTPHDMMENNSTNCLREFDGSTAQKIAAFRRLPSSTSRLLSLLPQ